MKTMNAMNWTIKAEHRDAETECRNAKKPAPSDLYFGIYNSDGYGVANIDRLGRIDAGGRLDFVHDHVECNDEPEAHATTDEQWQSIINTLAAAPEMLAVLKSIRDDLGCGEGVSAAEADVMRNSILAVLAKAEPPRTVQHTVWVTVAVEVETTPGAASEPGNVRMAAIEAVRDGDGEIVRDEIVE